MDRWTDEQMNEQKSKDVLSLHSFIIVIIMTQYSAQVKVRREKNSGQILSVPLQIRALSLHSLNLQIKFEFNALPKRRKFYIFKDRKQIVQGFTNSKIINVQFQVLLKRNL